jgi:hypothetical protein
MKPGSFDLGFTPKGQLPGFLILVIKKRYVDFVYLIIIYLQL